MKYHTLNQINDKLFFNIRKPIVNERKILSDFFNNLELDLEGLIRMCLMGPEPSQSMCIIDQVVRSLIFQQYYPCTIINRQQSINQLSDLTELIGVDEVEKLIYRFIIVMIPKHIAFTQRKMQEAYMSEQLLHNAYPIGKDN